MRNALLSLRARILVLIAIPFAVTLSMTIYHTFEEREDRLANARMHVLDTARVLAAEQQRIIEHIHQVLSLEALLPAVRRGVASDECDRALAARLRQEPNLNSIQLAIANGDVICNAIPNPRRISLADRDFFQAAVQTRTFSEGDFVISRITGRPAVGFAYPILDEAGVLRTVVATTLRLAWLEQQLAKAQLPNGARVVVVDGEGLVLARYPDPEVWVGRSAAELPLLRVILAKGDEGTAEGIGLDGQRKIHGFVPLHRTASGQGYLWVSVPKDVVVGPAQHAFIVSLIVGFGLLILTFGAVWLGSEFFFVRRMAALTDTAKELGKGNLSARVKLEATRDEIGRLATSFNQMANVYEQHERILRKSLEDFIQAISDAVEMRDPHTAGHQKDVARLAATIAGDLRLPSDEIYGINLAARIHDLGKLQVPAEILSKPDTLSDAEFAFIKAHAQAGYEILKGIEFPWPIANFVLQHHERLDGSGYPQGLKGDQILLGARIIAVADVVEKMASPRNYHSTLGLDGAFAEIKQGRGTVYDPAVVDACLRLFREERFAF